MVFTLNSDVLDLVIKWSMEGIGLGGDVGAREEEVVKSKLVEFRREGEGLEAKMSAPNEEG